MSQTSKYGSKLSARYFYSILIEIKIVYTIFKHAKYRISSKALQSLLNYYIKIEGLGQPNQSNFDRFLLFASASRRKGKRKQAIKQHKQMNRSNP
jgi:hypothetical protein